LPTAKAAQVLASTLSLTESFQSDWAKHFFVMEKQKMVDKETEIKLLKERLGKL